MSKKNLTKLALGVAINLKISPIFLSRDCNIIDKTFSLIISGAISAITSDYIVNMVSKELKKEE